MNRRIFRQEALDKLASPEQLDQLMPLTSPRTWMALGGVGLLFLMLLFWGVAGSIATTVDATGALVRPGGVTDVTAPITGVVARIDAISGKEVVEGQTLMLITPLNGKSPQQPASIASPASGRVLDITVLEGDVVDAGSMVIAIESTEQPLQAILYVPAADGYEIEPQMRVRVSPATGSRYSRSDLSGTVNNVGRVPATRNAMLRALQSEALVESVTGTGAVLEVIVDLDDPPEEIFSGTPCTAEVITSVQRPLRLLLPTVSESE